MLDLSSDDDSDSTSTTSLPIIRSVTSLEEGGGCGDEEEEIDIVDEGLRVVVSNDLSDDEVLLHPEDSQSDEDEEEEEEEEESVSGPSSFTLSKEYDCPVPGCTFIFSTFSEGIVRQHWKTTHAYMKNPTLFKSKSTPAGSSSQSSSSSSQVPVTITKRVDGKEVFECGSCGYETRYSSDIKIHTDSAHQFKCSYCPCQFQMKNQLTRHLEVGHKTKVNGGDSRANGRRGSSPNHVKTAQDKKKLSSHPCPRCSSQFVSQDLLDDHLRKEHRGALPKPQSSPQQSSSSKNTSPFLEPVPLGSYKMIVVDKIIGFRCEICGYFNHTLTDTHNHVRQCHGPNAQFPCATCVCRFTSHNALSLHMGKKHVDQLKPSEQYQNHYAELLTFEGVEIFKCKLCAYVTLDERKIRRKHVKVAHNPFDNFVCPTCPCRFASRGSLTNHKSQFHPQEEPQQKKLFTVSHEGEESAFQCKECDFSHNSHSVLLSHISAGHTSGGNGEPSTSTTLPLSQTEVSPALSSSPQTSTNPRRKGKPKTFSCELCKSKFVSQHELSTHIGMKHSEKENDCPRDGDGMKRKASSRRAPPPLPCRFRCTEMDCRYTTRRANEMKEHVKTHCINGFKCTYCASAFFELSDLDNHSNSCSKRRSSSSSTNRRSRGRSLRKKRQVDEETDIETRRVRRGRSRSVSRPRDSMPLKCSVSGCLFQTGPDLEDVMEEHKKTSHNPNTGRFRCELCPCRYKTKDQLHIHTTQYHPQAMEVDEDDECEGSDEGEEETVDDGTYKCPLCAFFVSNNRIAHAAHRTAAHNKKSPFQCSLCRCQYATKKGLNHHELEDHKGKSQKKTQTQPALSTSSFVPSTVSSSSKRIQSTSPGPKELVCIKCNVSCATQSQLNWHTERAHAPGLAGAKFKCDLCGFRYETEKGLRSHKSRTHGIATMNSHSLLKPRDEIETATGTSIEGQNIRKSLSKAARKYASNASIPGRPDPPSSSSESDDDEAEAAEDTGEPQPESSEDDDTQESEEEMETIESRVAKGNSTCDLCGTCFLKPSMLRIHQDKSHVPGGFPCRYCSCTFATRNGVQLHTFHIHPTKFKAQKGRRRRHDFGVRTSNRDIDENGRHEAEEVHAKTAELKQKKNMEPIPSSSIILKCWRVGCSEIFYSERALKRHLRQSHPGPAEPEDKEESDRDGNYNGTQATSSASSSSSSMYQRQDSTENENEHMQSEDDDGRNADGDELSLSSASTKKDSRSQKRKSLEKTEEDEVDTDTDRPDPTSKKLRTDPTSSESMNDAEKASSSSHATKTTAAFTEFMRFTCNRCACTFETSMRLVDHFMTCDKTVNLFRCNLCDNTCDDLAKLKAHVWEMHMTDPDKKRCVSTPGADGRISKPWVCEICKYGLKDRKEFMMHLSIAHLFRCRKCSFVCDTYEEFKAHKRQPPHAPTPNASANGNNNATEDGRSDDEISFVGVVPAPPGSGSSATNVGPAPAQNKTNVASPNQQEEGMEVDNDDIEVLFEGPPPLKCDKCGHVSETIEKAMEHRKALGTMRSLICFICGEASATACDAALHQKMHEGQAGPSSALESASGGGNTPVVDTNDNPVNVANDPSLY